MWLMLFSYFKTNKLIILLVETISFYLLKLVLNFKIIPCLDGGEAYTSVK